MRNKIDDCENCIRRVNLFLQRRSMIIFLIRSETDNVLVDNIVPEFNLDELIDVAERVGSFSGPRLGPRASSIVLLIQSLSTLITRHYVRSNEITIVR